MPTAVEMYGWCGITPIQYQEYTPAELELMLKVQKIKMGAEDAPREPMTNPEMQSVCNVITEAMGAQHGV